MTTVASKPWRLAAVSSCKELGEDSSCFLGTYQITNLAAEAVKGLSALRYCHLTGLRDLCEFINLEDILPSVGVVSNKFFVTTTHGGRSAYNTVKSLMPGYTSLHTWLIQRETNSLQFLLLVRLEEDLIHVPVVNTIDDAAS